MNKFRLLLIFVFFTSAVRGQEILVLDNPIDSFISLNEHVISYVDSTRSLNYNDVQGLDFSPNVLTGNSKDKKLWDNFYWRKFRLKNNQDSTIRISLNSRRFLNSIAYIHVRNKLVDTIQFGPIVPFNKWNIDYYADAFDLELIPNSIYTILIHSRRPHTRNMSLRLSLFNPNYLHNKVLKSLYDYRNVFFWQLSFIAILFFLFCFTVFQYFQHKESTYFYYSAYLLVMVIYFLNRHEGSTFINIFFSYNPSFINHYSGGEPSLISQFVFIFYMLFANSFLDLSKNSPKLSKLLKCFVVGILIAYFIQVVMYFVDFKPSVANYFNDVFRGLLNIIFIGILVAIYLKIKTKLAVYFLIGSLALVIGSIISLYWNTLGFPRISDSIIFTQIGTLIECLFFSAGLGYRTKLILDEKNRTQEELIIKLEENKVLQDQLTKNLKQEVDSTNEEKKLINYKNKILMLESDLLSSQMNPHFIFNSLNSIKYYALAKSPEETAKFVTSFAKLMRIILNNSKRKTISLSEEIEFLERYLSVEQKRFDKKFKYEIIVEDGINLDKTLLPPMLLQPYIENALWHGLLHKEGTGNISVIVSEDHKSMIFIIEDDGIGRKASEVIKQAKNTTRTYSQGTSITSNRLQLLNEMYKTDASIEIEDRIDKKGKPYGTRITLRIPEMKHIE